MKRSTFAIAAACALLSVSACASTPSTYRPAYQMAMEHFDLQEAMGFKAAAEARKGWRIENITGGSGRIVLTVMSSRSSAEVMSDILDVLDQRGYDIRDIRVSTNDGRSFVIDRIVDSGFRPKP